MRTRLIVLAVILSVATFAAVPIASASAGGGGGSTSSSGGGGGGGGGHGGGGGGGGGHGGGGGGHSGGGGGGHFGGGFHGAFGAIAAGANRGGGYGGHGISMAHGFYAAHLGYGLIGLRSAGLGHVSAVHVGMTTARAMRLAVGPQFRSAATARPVMDHGHHPGHHPGHHHHPYRYLQASGSCGATTDCEPEYLFGESCPFPYPNRNWNMPCPSAVKMKARK